MKKICETLHELGAKQLIITSVPDGKESMIEAHRFVYACMEESLKMEYEEREGLMIEKNLYMLV